MLVLQDNPPPPAAEPPLHKGAYSLTRFVYFNSPINQNLNAILQKKIKLVFIGEAIFLYRRGRRLRRPVWCIGYLLPSNNQKTTFSGCRGASPYRLKCYSIPYILSVFFASSSVGYSATCLASARSRSGSDNTPCCHSRPSRRFATRDSPQALFFWLFWG